MIEAIHGRFGDHFVESTSSEDARAFKARNTNRDIDGPYIDERESLYLNLSRRTLITMRDMINAGHNVVTSDSTLVTRLSHNVMRAVRLGENIPDDVIIRDWRVDEDTEFTQPPDIVVLTSPPITTIENRIVQRQVMGMRDEQFYGFNALDFLDAYRDRWEQIVPRLSSVIPCLLQIDTSVVSIDESIERYAMIRNQLPKQT